MDPKVNKIVSRGKKWKKCFMCNTKLTCAPYAKQKTNLAFPNTIFSSFE